MPRATATAALPEPDVVDTLLAFVCVLRSLQLSQRDHPWLALPLTMAQLKALMLILQTGGMPSRHLADRLGIGASAVTPLVDRLVQQKLVRRNADANDRRIAWIRPTAKAIALRDRVMETNRSVLARVLDEVPRGEHKNVHTGLHSLLHGAERTLQRAQKKKAG